MGSIVISGIYVARLKRLKGGKVINRSIRRIKYRGVVQNDPSSTNWSTWVDNSKIYARLGGDLDVITGEFKINPDKTNIFELKTPYLRKHFKTIIGIDISAVYSH